MQVFSCASLVESCYFILFYCKWLNHLTLSPLSSHSTGSPDPEPPDTTLFVTVFFQNFQANMSSLRKQIKHPEAGILALHGERVKWLYAVIDRHDISHDVIIKTSVMTSSLLGFDVFPSLAGPFRHLVSGGVIQLLGLVVVWRHFKQPRVLNLNHLSHKLLRGEDKLVIDEPARSILG